MLTAQRFKASEVMSCEELHAVLHLVLQAGNILNAVSDANRPPRCRLTCRPGAP